MISTNTVIWLTLSVLLIVIFMVGAYVYSCLYKMEEDKFKGERLAFNRMEKENKELKSKLDTLQEKYELKMKFFTTIIGEDTTVYNLKKYSKEDFDIKIRHSEEHIKKYFEAELEQWKQQYKLDWFDKNAAILVEKNNIETIIPKKGFKL